MGIAYFLIFMTRKRKVYVAIGLVLSLGLIANGLWGGAELPVYEVVTAEKKDIVSEISITGQVKAAQTVDLAFLRSGRVAALGATVGGKVKAGQTLLALESRQLSAEIARASANVESSRASLRQYEAAVGGAQAKLDELTRGNRPEEINLAEIKVENVQKALVDAQEKVEQTTNKAAVDLVNAYDGIKDVLPDAFTRVDDAVNRQTDDFFYNDATSAPVLTFSTLHPQVKLDIEWQRVVAGNALAVFKFSLVNIQSLGLASLEETLQASKKNILAIRDFLQKANEAVLDSGGLTAATVDAYRSDVTAGLTSVNTALSVISGQEQKIAAQKVVSQNSVVEVQARLNDARSALTSAQAELNLKRAPATVEELSAQRAQVKQAEANASSARARVREAQAAVASLEAQLSENILTAPFSGTVTRQEAKVGEIVSPGALLVSLIAEDKFEIEANLPEVDIAKIYLQDAADVTLDAYGDDAHFAATLIAIDPAATMVEAVPTYKIRLQFNDKDERVKSGMTANVVIFADKREQVLAVPARAIIEDDGQKTVRVLMGEGRKQKAEERVITLGLRGSDGSVEVLSGLNEGDKVITGEQEK